MPILLVALLSVLAADAAGAQDSTHRATITRLASDEAAGRVIGTEALVAQQHYAAERFTRAGLLAVGADDLFHPFPLWFAQVDRGSMLLRREVSLPPLDRWSARVPHSLVPLVDWMVLSVGGHPVRAAVVPESANVVFGGRFGASTAIKPSQARGKVVIFDAPLRPDGTDDFEILARREGLTAYRSAAALLFSVLDLTPSSRRRPVRSVRADVSPASSEDSLPPILAISDYARLVILNEQLRPGWQYASATPGLRNHRITLAWRETVTEVGPSSRNVVGKVGGTDSSASREYIVVLGRLDHFGMEPPRTGGFFQPPRTDSVYFGADVGGTSAAVVLALADRIAASPTRRSVLFVLTSGAEGAMGAHAFLAKLPVPAERIVAVVSADRVGQPMRDSLHAFGVAADASEGEFRLVAPARATPRWICESDYAVVARGGLRSMLLTTGTSRPIEPLHDRASAIDYTHLGRVIDAIERQVRALGDGSETAVRLTGVPPMGCDILTSSAEPQR
jgi:hypothetical protein